MYICRLLPYSIPILILRDRFFHKNYLISILHHNFNIKTIFSIKMSHTILLVQPGTKPETRTYSDYESVNECMEGVCKIYEEHLKRQNPSIPSITYDISQLFEFIDQLSGAKNNQCLFTLFVEAFLKTLDKDLIDNTKPSCKNGCIS